MTYQGDTLADKVVLARCLASSSRFMNLKRRMRQVTNRIRELDAMTGGPSTRRAKPVSGNVTDWLATPETRH